MALENEGSNDSSYQVDGRNNHKMNVSPSPMSIRSSSPITPVIYPFSPALSMGAPFSYSVQYDPSDSFEEDINLQTQPAPSQWRLLKMNALEWRSALIGCVAAIGSGAVQPINAY